MTPALVLLVQNACSHASIVELGSDFRTIRSTGVESAYEIARTKRPDCIAVDLDVHGVWAVCRLLKRDPSTASIPVLIVTATRTPETLAHAKFAGAEAVLTETDSLGQWIATMLDRATRTNAA